MKITIEGDAKEIAALLGTERLITLKEELLSEIAHEVERATAYHIKPLQERETETPCPAHC